MSGESDRDDGSPEVHAELLGLIDVVRTLLETAPCAIGDDSRMAADRVAVPGLLDLPSLCHHYLNGSVDLLLALHQLMQPEANTLQLPMLALYPLIRGVMESSGQVVWVLGPDDRRERFRRILQLQKDELDYDRKYVDTLTRLRVDDTNEYRSMANRMIREHRPKGQMRRQRFRDAATVLGIDRSDFEHGLTGGYEAVIREAANEQDLDQDFHGRQFASIWVFVSGLAHPSMSRAWAGSINTPGDVNPEGFMPVRSTANPEVVRDGLGVAIALHARALLMWKNAAAPVVKSGPDG